MSQFVFPFFFVFQVTPYIAEFWNTVSNVWMIVPPLYGLWDARRQRLETK